MMHEDEERASACDGSERGSRGAGRGGVPEVRGAEERRLLRDLRWMRETARFARGLNNSDGNDNDNSRLLKGGGFECLV